MHGNGDVVHNGFMAQNVEEARIYKDLFIYLFINETSNVVGKSVAATEEIQKLF